MFVVVVHVQQLFVEFRTISLLKFFDLFNGLLEIWFGQEGLHVVLVLLERSIERRDRQSRKRFLEGIGLQTGSFGRG